MVGRIVAVADVFDSLSHERPYKAACDLTEALGIIEGGRGSHFDPRVVDAFLELVGDGDLSKLQALEDAEAEYVKTARPRTAADLPPMIAPVS